MRVLPVVQGVPSWLGSRSDPPWPPLDAHAREAWSRLLGALVDRYGRRGSLWRQYPSVRKLPITAWQIWNEPTLRVYWGGKPNAKQYVAMLRTVGRAIKSRDRKAEIVTAGLPPSLLTGAIRLQKFIKQMYKAGGGRALDTVAINSYAVSDKYLGKLMDDMRKLINRSGGRADKIWITELGWCDKGAKSRFCVGTKRQVKYVRGSLKLIKRKRTAWKLRGFVYFSWRDGRPYAPKFNNLWGLHTGLLSISGKKKPVYNAFAKGVKGF